MYCPGCGVKNEGSPLKCFICGKVLPTGDRPVTPDTPRRRSPQTLAGIPQPFAAIGDRMLALILDRLVVIAVLAIPAALIAERWHLTPMRAAVIGASAVLATALVYHIVLEALFGATLGKGLLGLYIRGGSQPWISSAIRNVTRLVDAILFYAIAFVVAVFSSKRQRLGDYFAGTTVIERRVEWGSRAALMFIWVVLVGGSLWLALSLCPSCMPDNPLWATLR
ncbi:MAG TPA: RDD family protein [Thermoanaerobaculia bacterium]|nr:RDD family protein [Thermoanaerobaculia bacterium]